MHSTQHLIDIALSEDIGSGDITTENLIDGHKMGTGIIVAKEPLILAGLKVSESVFHRLDPEIAIELPFPDG